MNPDRAEILALGALAWLARHDLLDAFAGISGADSQSMRQAAGDPIFLAAVMDFVMGSDDWVLGFCDEEGLTTETFLAARAALPGGDLPNWT